MKQKYAFISCLFYLSKSVYKKQAELVNYYQRFRQKLMVSSQKVLLGIQSPLPKTKPKSHPAYIGRPQIQII